MEEEQAATYTSGLSLHKACTGVGLVLLGFPLRSGACEECVMHLQNISQLCSVSGMDDLCLAMLTENLWALLSSFSLSKEKACRQTDHLCCVLQLQSLSQPL